MNYTKGKWMVVPYDHRISGMASVPAWSIETDANLGGVVQHQLADIVPAKTTSTYIHSEECEANAYLMAASPDMHKLLSHPIGSMVKDDDPDTVWIRLAKDEYDRVLNKAVGKEKKG